MATPVSINKSLLFKRAWELFRETFNYPRLPFASIGRHCFGWALAKAWAEVREAATLRAIPAAEKARHIASLQEQITTLEYMPFGHRIAPKRRALEAKIQKLAA